MIQRKESEITPFESALKCWLYLLSVIAMVAAVPSTTSRMPLGPPPFRTFEDRISDALAAEGASQDLEMRLTESVSILKTSIYSQSEGIQKAEGISGIALIGLSIALFITAFLTPPRYIGRKRKREPNKSAMATP